MHVVRIDHVNIIGSPELVAKCRTFYIDILGLQEGYRPPFRSSGFWLYAGKAANVHLTVKNLTHLMAPAPSITSPSAAKAFLRCSSGSRFTRWSTR